MLVECVSPPASSCSTAAADAEPPQLLVKEPWRFPMAAQHLAAIKIQQHVRGMLLRRNALPTKRDRSRSNLVARFMRARRRDPAGGGEGADPMEGFEDFCVTKLQAAWRRFWARRLYCLFRFPMYHIAAMQIQYTFRGHLARKRRRERPSSIREATLMLQAAWRAYANRKIYRYYRDLISFRMAGDPRVMLRSINPREAALLDSAAGLHVRLRLGGVTFPPTIYYKIFTHKAVCDVGSFSPKDYTLPNVADAAPRHNRSESQAWSEESAELRGDSLRRRRGLPPRHDAWAGSATPLGRASRAAADVAAQFGILVEGEEGDGSGEGVALRARMAVGRTGCRATLSADSADQLARGYGDRWYQRWENNGWRPVTVKTLDEADKDPVYKLTADPRKPFHFSRLRRKSDLRLQCKQRKREWLRKLYLSGLAEERKDRGGEVRDEDEGADGGAGGGEPELDELLEWSEALDFDDYMQSWRAVGTSAPTEGPMVEEGEEADLLSEYAGSAAGGALREP